MEFSKTKLFALVSLRLVIGWHFFYEGMVKILNPAWTSKAYLLDSGGFLKEIFGWIALNDAVLWVVDAMNAWGLMLIGFSLLIGLFTNISAISGMILLFFYYLSHPALPGIEYLFPVDGSYFIVNKTIVELFALFVIFAFPTSQNIGLERFYDKAKNTRA
ncbi:MAG: DoxX family membrane protein [Lentimicrobium sp.]|nr:DoxX family membrane protein [Lentimicrobium sp.]